MTARQLLRQKTPAVYTVPPEARLVEAARLLRRHDVGALLVLDGEALVGIVSERDVVRAVVDEGALALGRPVRIEMSAPVETCGPDDEVRTLMARMTARRIRHLPVVEDGRVLGVVSIGDAVKSRVDEMKGEAAVLQDALTLRWAAAVAS